jgi:hypothetical protein
MICTIALEALIDNRLLNGLVDLARLEGASSGIVGAITIPFDSGGNRQ